MKTFVTSVLFTLLVLIGVSGLALASTAPARLSIPGTKLLLNGRASPGALVQIYDDGALVGSVVADSTGTWSKDFPSIAAGLHSLRLSYQDQDGLLSASVEEVINVRSQSNTTASYFLPPTLEILPNSLSAGGVVSLSGSSVPNATLDLVVDGGGLILRPQTDTDGRYSIAFNTTSYFAGQHVVEGTARLLGQTSYGSGVKTFQITAPGDQTVPRSLEPPRITTPSPITTEQQDTVIRGTAAPLSQVIGYLDGQEIGSTFANANGEWFLSVRLFSSSHLFQAQACFGDDCSERSNSVDIVFTGTALCRADFQLSGYRFWNLNKGDDVSLTVFNLLQQPPYGMIVNWGDGSTAQFDHDSGSPVDLDHTYQEAGQFNGSLTLSDATGCEHTRYFSVDVDSRYFDWQWTLALVPPALGVLALAVYRLRKRALIQAANAPDSSGSEPS